MSQLPAKEVYKFIDGFVRKTEFLEFARAELALKDHEINGILDDFSDSREQKYQIISLWRRKRGREANMHLLYVLRDQLTEQTVNCQHESANESFLTSSPNPSGNDNVVAEKQSTIGFRDQASLQNAHESSLTVANPAQNVKSTSCTDAPSSNLIPGQTIPEYPPVHAPSPPHEIPESSSQTDGPLHNSGQNIHTGHQIGTDTTKPPQPGEERVSPLSKNIVATEDDKVDPTAKAWGMDIGIGYENKRAEPTKLNKDHGEIDNNLPLAMKAMAMPGISMCDEVTDLSIDKCSEEDIKTIQQNDNIYTIENKPKGYVLIINNNFKGEKGYRSGASVDVENMEKLWKGLDCAVTIKEDLPEAELLKILDKLTNSEKLGKYDFFVMFIMSHGTHKDSFKTADGKYVKLEEVLQKFDNQKSRYLIGKPKLFFFQFCRGRNIDYGLSVQQIDSANPNQHQPEFDYVQGDHENALGLHTARSDMLISYPTQPGYRSYRGQRGSWFMNAIANVFSRYAKSEHVSDMMIRVRKAIMEKTGVTESYETANVTCKQMGECRDLLSKKLYLMPGYPEDDLLF